MPQGESKIAENLSHVVEVVKTAEDEAVEFVKTLAWTQIEHWQQDNEYILSGYRRSVRTSISTADSFLRSGLTQGTGELERNA